MHLVLLTEEFYGETTGGAHARTRFAELAVSNGHDVTVFMPNNADRQRYEVINGIEIHRTVPTLFGREGYNWVSILLRVLFSIHLTITLLFWARKRTIDGLHPVTNSVHWTAKVIGYVYSIPVVNFIGYTPTLDPGESKFSPRSLLEAINFRWCMGDVVYCRTQTVATAVQEASGTITEPIDGILDQSQFTGLTHDDFQATRSQFDVSPDGHLFAFVGRLVPIKQPKKAITVFDDLHNNGHFVVIGDGPSRTDVEDLVHARNLEDRTTLLGETAHADVLHILGAADALLLTSRAEAYPTVVFEALALGTHVFAPPVGMLPNLNHERLHLCRIQSMAAQINATDFESQHAVDNEFLQQYSLEAYTDRIVATFESLNQQNRPRDGHSEQGTEAYR